MDVKERVEQYLAIARSTGVFNQHDIDILDEVASDCVGNPDTTYVLLDEKIDGRAVGFVIVGRTPITTFGWDLYWLAVDASAQGKGLALKLFARAEAYMQSVTGRAVVRIETSSKDGYTPARNLYVRAGYTEMGRIPEFYGENDSLVMFFKSVGCQDAGCAR
jgi:ribosomal protein S18 acetylase RimI-like enzyme